MHNQILFYQNEIEKFNEYGDFTKVKEICNKLLEIDPTNQKANFHRAKIEFTNRNFFDASKFSLQVFKKDPNNQKNISILIKSLINLNLTEQAKLLLENYLIENPNEIDAEIIELKNKLVDKNTEQVSIKNSIGKDKKSLNILFIQDSPCIRNYKYASALKKRGHKVTLAYYINKLSERYKGMTDDAYEKTVKIISNKQLWELAKNYDLIHSHNEPDQYTVAALASGIPVIHDTHDLISLRDAERPELKYFEGIANRAATGRIYSTPYQMGEAKNLYDISGPSLIFYNYASEDHLPKKYLPKLSKFDGNLHVVYEGGVSGSEGKHRDFTDQFIRLAQYGFYVHIYPARFDESLANLFNRYENIEYNKPIPPEKLIETMTQYDFGIIPWNLIKGNERFLASTIANKLFEYLAAGLPVVTADIKSYRDFFSENPVGFTFKNIEELVSKIDILKNISDRLQNHRTIYTYESEIQRLENFYHQIIDNRKDILKTNYKSEITSKIQSQNETDLKIDKSFQKLLEWIMINGWKGYDPYDAEDYIIQKKNSGNPLGKDIESKIRSLNNSQPLKLRIDLSIEKKINAKAMGLLLNSYVNLFSLYDKEEYLNEAIKISNWLLENKSKNYNNYCWGYPFDWQSIIFIPKDTPSVVVSTIVGQGFWKLYEITLRREYLEVCISICKFILEDLSIDNIDNDKICFSYTPIDNYHVHNANLFASEFLIKIGKEIDEESYVQIGIKAANYAVSEQNEDGSIFYWGKDQDKNNPQHLDSYHSGFEIRMLFSIYHLTGNDKYKIAYEKYLIFFKDNYLSDSGAVLQFTAKKNQSQINIHGVAEAILMFSILAIEHQELQLMATDLLKWSIDNFQDSEGWFGYLIQNNQKLMIPYLRWGEAWMLLAFSEYLKINKQRSLEWGSYLQFSNKPGIKADYHKSKNYNSILNHYKNLLIQYKNIDPDYFPIDLINHVKDFILNVEPNLTSHNDIYNYIVNFNDNISNTLVSADTQSEEEYSYKKFQIVMPEVPNYKYGSVEWTDYLYEHSIADPWGQDWRASQLIRYEKSLELLNKNIKDIRISKILDIGCAFGTFTEMLYNNYKNNLDYILGVDISKAAVNKNKIKYDDINFIVSSLPELENIEDESYDLISALEVVYYVEPDRMSYSLKKIKQKLRTGGYLLISTYLNQPPFNSSSNFKEFLQLDFTLIDSLQRFHKDYYKYFETPLRNILNYVYQSNFTINKLADKFINSSFELLSDKEYIEFINNSSYNNNKNDSLSHIIVLAQKND